MLSEQNRLSFRLMWLWKCVKGRKNSVPPKQPWKPEPRLLVMSSVCEEESCEGRNLLFCPQGSSAFANSRFYGWGLYWAEQSGKCIFTPACIKRVPILQKYVKNQKTKNNQKPSEMAEKNLVQFWSWVLSWSFICCLCISCPEPAFEDREICMVGVIWGLLRRGLGWMTPFCPCSCFPC